MFVPTIFDVGIMIGTFGLFFTCFLIFIRVLPMVAIWEVKSLVGHRTIIDLLAARTQKSISKRPDEESENREVAGA